MNNSFGKIFKILTWGESHGKAMGVVIDGCPAGIEIIDEEINKALALRSPGNSPYTSPRKEKDQAEILSGVFEGKTTGAPISIIIPNSDHDSHSYEGIKNSYRPGHANFTYLEKYGIFDHRGGGRASARETVGRVAASVIAKKMLEKEGIQLISFIKEIGTIKAEVEEELLLKESIYKSPVFCPDLQAEEKMKILLEQVKREGDSLGGVVEFIAKNVPIGLGDPVFGKLQANISHAMMSIPACKAVEIGSGCEASDMKGSEHNDAFIVEDEKIRTTTNHAGGILGGISNGMPITGRVVFKPTSSIKKAQNSVNISKEAITFNLPEGSRHDPCVAIRAVPIVEAMLALVLADSLLLNRLARL